MMHLLTGPYRSGKTNKLLTNLVEFKLSNPLENAILLVPSARTRDLLRDRIAQLIHEKGAPGLCAVNILPFYQACQWVLNEHSHHQQVLSRDVCRAIIADLLLQLKNERKLSFLEPISEFGGTSSALLSLFEEFERAALTPDEVVHRLSNTAASDSKYMELGRLYGEYWEKLSNAGALDEKRLAFAATQALQKRDSGTDLNISYLAIDGFDRISPLQALFIRALASVSNHSEMTFDYVDDLRLEDSKADDYGWKKKSFGIISEVLSPQVEWVRPPASSGAPTSSFCALDRFFEMKQIARRCKEAIIRRERNHEEILVVVRNTDQYRLAILAAFEEAGLDCALDASFSVTELPVVQFVLKLASISMRDYERDHVISVLRSKFLSQEGTGFDRRSLAQIDAKSSDSRIACGLENWLNANRLMPDDRLKNFLHAVTPSGGFSPLEHHIRWLEDLLDKYLYLPADERKPSSREAQPEREGLSAIRQALRTMLTHQNFSGGVLCTYETFFGKFESLLDGAKYQNRKQSPKSILVCSAETAPNKKYKEIYIAGVLEGSFPRRIGQGGFISLDETAAWTRFGVDITDPRQDPGFERALFNSLLDRAEESICISYPRFDLSGDETIPSFYFKDGTINLDHKTQYISPYDDALALPASPEEAIGAWLWQSASVDLPEKWLSELPIDSAWQRFGLACTGASLRLVDAPNNAFNGDLTPLTEAGMLSVELPELLSATALNAYGQCPFRFWLTHILKTTPREAVEAGLTPAARGIAFHRTLEIYFKRLRDENVEAGTEVSLSILREAFAQAIQETENRRDFQPGKFWENEKKDMFFRLQRFVTKEAEYLRTDELGAVPAMFEASFGEEKPEAFPALTIDTEHGAVKIRGTIDRIDLSSLSPGNALASIVDYKSGSASISSREAEEGTNIQLPLYALAVEKTILPGCEVKTARYVSISAAKGIGNISFDKKAHLKQKTVEHVAAAARGIRSGRFVLNPKSEKFCNSCDHFNICRIQELSSSDEAEF